jgi:hypothetical protein
VAAKTNKGDDKALREALLNEGALTALLVHQNIVRLVAVVTVCDSNINQKSFA